MKNVKFIDLFAGIGGFRIAAEELGGQCVFSCEIDKTAQYVYRKNFGDYPYPDIRRLTPKDLPDFDLLMAGFPCQPFSISGKRKGFEDKRNGNLFFYIVDIAKEKQPPVMILENVKNFYRHDNGRTFRIAKSLLESSGYNVYASILNSKDFGLPQNRERVFIVAIHKDINFRFDFEALIKSEKQEFKVLEDILDDNPEDALFYKGDYVIIRDDPKYKVNRPYQIGYVAKGRQGERIYSIKGIAVTISHSTGGVFPKTGGYKTKEGIRTLTVNEVKKVFGFPSNFSFDGVGYSKAIALLGNSVAVNVVKAILNVLFKRIFLAEEIGKCNQIKKNENLLHLTQILRTGRKNALRF